MSSAKGILGEIARRKRWEREILKDALRGNLREHPDSAWLPSENVRDTARRYLRQGGHEGNHRPFAASLSHEHRLSVIAEVKRRSPSRGVIASWDLPEPLAEAYGKGGASALSVLTDAHFFDGRPAFLSRCRQVFEGPVLRKDFIVDELDLAITAALEADAVLLIAALVGPQIGELVRLARCYDLEVLAEVHTERELEYALIGGATTVGINNRNLETFEVDLAITERLAARIPGPFGVVSESGIKGPQDALRVRKAGADAILVGEHLAKQQGEGLDELCVEAARGVRG